jgi:hypothetical protein
MPAGRTDLKEQKVAGSSPGETRTTLSYNAGVVKIYSATNSMARFCNKYYFSLT